MPDLTDRISLDRLWPAIARVHLGYNGAVDTRESRKALADWFASILAEPPIIGLTEAERIDLAVIEALFNPTLCAAYRRDLMRVRQHRMDAPRRERAEAEERQRLAEREAARLAREAAEQEALRRQQQAEAERQERLEAAERRRREADALEQARKSARANIWPPWGSFV